MDGKPAPTAAAKPLVPHAGSGQRQESPPRAGFFFSPGALQARHSPTRRRSPHRLTPCDALPLQ